MDKLHAMAEALMQYETLSSEQIDAIMAGEPVSDVDEGDDEHDRGSPDVHGPRAPEPAPAAPRLSAQPVAEHFRGAAISDTFRSSSAREASVAPW